MHISEGVLSGPVLAAGAVLTVAGVSVGLRKMEQEQVPRVAVLSSAFFVASLIHIPVGPSNVHMILNGLAGIVLGWSVFPALLVALFLQAIIFQFGGLTTLGVNTFNMAVPALVCHFAFSGFLRRATERFPLFTGGFLAGASAVLMSAALMALCLHTTGKEFTAVGAVVVLAHVPVMILEGFITGIMVLFIRRVRPEILALDEAVSQ